MTSSRLGIVTFMLIGCGGAAAKAPAPPATDTALVARPCDALHASGDARAPESFFVEVADVTSPVGPPGAPRLDHPVRVRFVAGMLLARGSDSAPAPSETGELRVRLRDVPADADSPVELEVDIGEGAPRRAIVRTNDQVPFFVTRDGAAYGGALVVTPYFLFEPRQQSIEKLEACKLAEDRSRGTRS